MKKVLFLLFTICCTIQFMNAQTLISMGGSTTDVTGCNFWIFDNGGQNGDYGPYRNDLLTIHSGNPSTPCVQVKVDLTDLAIHFTDTLFIYNGDSDADSLLLGKVNNAMLNGISSTDMIYTATVANPTGALTLKFVSDSAHQSGGFHIETSCVKSCQRVGVEIDSALSSHYPHLEDDGYYYVDLCEKDSLHLVVHGVYPDNDYNYHQNDATTLFKWDMDMDYFEGNGLTTMDYFFNNGRGYDISISNIDSAHCENHMPLTFRIRTSANPIKHVAKLPPMCSGDEITVTAGYSNLSILQIDSVHSEQITSLAVTDTIFLPDGQDCGNGCAYNSSVTFTAFAPNATITSADDILYVRAKLEHSYVGDIYIALTCPNGTRSALMKKSSGGSSSCSGQIPSSEWGWNASNTSSSAYFGVPVDEEGSNKCDPNEYGNRMGTPWNYCWSNNVDPYYNYQYANGQGYVYETVNIHNNRIDSTNTLNMTNVYHPDVPFSNLIGCPLNGTWSLTIIDGFSIDNGWVTEWELALDPSLVPQDWSYTVYVDTMFVTGPGADGSTVIPMEAGEIPYVVHVIDDLGCEYDTTLVLEVIEKPQPDLGEDITICHGELYQLHSNYDHEYSSLIWNTGERTPDIYLSSSGEYSVRITVTHEDGLECTGSDTVNVNIVPTPIPNFLASDTSGCAPLAIHLTNTTIATDTTTMTYQWIIYDENGNTLFSSDKVEPDFSIDQDGTYNIFLLASTDQGCRDSITKYNYIKVNYQPAAEFDALPDVALWSETNGTIFFLVQGDTTAFSNNMSFSWDFGDGSTDSSTFAPEHNYSSWGDYDVTLSMFTPEGCNSSITHTVTLEADLVFPNVITPNDDGINDVFAIGNLNTTMNEFDPDKYRNNELTIYDRWGKQVYHAKNYDTFIDLTGERGNGVIKGDQVFDGSKLNDGSYFYTFYYKGKFKTVNYHGTLQIIRDK